MDVKSWGDIAVDDIKVLDGVSMTDCKGEGICSKLQHLRSEYAGRVIFGDFESKQRHQVVAL